jgi:hypothetical protein
MLLPLELLARIARYLVLSQAIELSEYEARLIAKEPIGDCNQRQSVFDIAAAHGDLKTLKWIHKQPNFKEINGLSSRNLAMDKAAKNGQLQVLKWMKQVGVGQTFYADLCAAGEGHLETLIWIHENEPSVFGRYLFYWAAERGHLHIVKWLHYNRNEVATTNSIDWAAKNGHLEIIKWLIANRKDGYSMTAIDYAIDNEHHEIVEFLKNCRVKPAPYSERATRIRTSYRDVIRSLKEI